MSVLNETTDDAPVMGRRERKRLETRNALVNAAFTLFAERGFDDVTVVDITRLADLDPSTFFRHFRSKESVLFTDLADDVGRTRSMLLARPSGENLLDSLLLVAMANAESSTVNLAQEALRMSLTIENPAIQAQALLHRDELVSQLTSAIGERVGLDPASDPRPLLAASSWVTGFEWYRANAVRTGRKLLSPPKAMQDIVDLLRPHWHILNELSAPESSAPTAATSTKPKKAPASTKAARPKRA
jgi:AcrR family transcriptional regulator